MANKKTKSIIDIVQGISQVMANSFDGACDQEGKPIKIGLKREVDNTIIDSRMMDGYTLRVQGEFLIITYHAQILMSDIHNKKFEKDIEGIFDDIVKFVKKQYKAYTKDTLSLKEKGQAKIKVETMSRIRSWVIAQKIYKIGSMEMEDVGDSKKLDKAIEKWLSLKSEKKPKNVRISKSANDKE